MSFLAEPLGDPDQPGPLVVRVKLPANTKIMRHTHPEARTYKVLSARANLSLPFSTSGGKRVALPNDFRETAAQTRSAVCCPGCRHCHSLGPRLTALLQTEDPNAHYVRHEQIARVDVVASGSGRILECALYHVAAKAGQSNAQEPLRSSLPAGSALANEMISGLPNQRRSFAYLIINGESSWIRN
jgi:hypothetical protein